MNVGRKSAALPEVPEDQPADGGALLSDEEQEQAVKAAGRSLRRLSAPAAELHAEAEAASGRGRRRSASAAVASASATPSRARRSNK